MAIPRRVMDYEDYFQRAQVLTTTAGVGGWAVADTSSAGTPTYTTTTTLGMVLTCDNTSEAQNVCMYHKDILHLDVDQLIWFEFWAAVTGVDAVTTITMGLGTARNDTPDSVADNVWFRMEGSVSTTLVLAESDDAASDLDDKATGQVLTSVVKRFHISFANGKTDIRMFMGNTTNGQLIRVAPTTTFTLSGLTTGLQPIFQLQKASGTGIPALQIPYVAWAYRKNGG